MNEYAKIFGISAPPSQVVFYKHNEAFSCGVGIKYKDGIIRWGHNITIKHTTDYKYKHREKVKYLGAPKRKLNKTSIWPRFVPLSKISLHEGWTIFDYTPNIDYKIY